VGLTNAKKITNKNIQKAMKIAVGVKRRGE
jgi:hypothetical protein